MAKVMTKSQVVSHLAENGRDSEESGGGNS